MRLAGFSHGGFRFSGECPHCGHLSAFQTVSAPFVEAVKTGVGRWIAPMSCIACNGYILGIVQGEPPKYVVYEAHYPIGLPNDAVPEEIPEPIREDFREALRCHWVKSWRATVLMCRRALQVSCDKEGAIGKDLFNQIDDLAQKGQITATLARMAHRIRLLGKKGAHGDYSDIDATIQETDADDAITFMTHYFEHVYVLPKRLEGAKGVNGVL